MRVTTKHITSGRVFDELLPLLEGRVFHVTKEENWPRIQAIGSLLAVPPEGQYVSSFGSKSYFRQRGCVSLFDYRNCQQDKFQEHYYNCLPTFPLTEECAIRILFLSPNRYDQLVSWEDWRKDGIGTNIVPYVEVGFEGEIPLDHIEEALIVTITEDRNSLAYRLKAAMAKHRDR